MSIKFKETYYDEREIESVRDAMQNGTDYLGCAKEKLSKIYKTENIFLTANGSLALDVLLFAYDFPKGSEVILPSFTYPSAGNSIFRMGLIPIFCDIDSQTLVMDIDDAKKRITNKTVCVIPTHYGGASCDMDELKKAFKGITIIEDSALSLGALYKGSQLGTLGNAATVSFHKTKNISSDEGGAIILNDPSIIKKLETIYNNGTDRQSFLRGDVPFYSWQEVGLNAVMSNISAAILCAQLDKLEEIVKMQTQIYTAYMNYLAPATLQYGLTLPIIREYNFNNAHVFYVIFKNEAQKERASTHLKSKDIGAVTHYEPLHLSSVGYNMGNTYSLQNTEYVCKCMLRLPMHASMTLEDCILIAKEIEQAL